MLKIVICDDQPEMLSFLVNQTREFFSSQKLEFEISEFDDGAEVAALYSPENKPFDLILLDGKMKKIHGDELARIIRRFDSEAIIIFISSWIEFSIKGYEVKALRFVPKTARKLKKNLRAAFESVMSELTRSKSIPVSLNNGKDYFLSHEIYFIEVMGRSLFFNLKDEIKTHSGKIKDFEEQLSGRGFVRCHRAYIVNIAKIRKITGDIITLDNGVTIPLSRSKRREVTDEFTRYCGNI
ncbi:MAG: LytTR family DNA-binding domain-containing protein [Oscillospiraceae bacterium]|nr:LytTR family DNA-binding domain-containing protein [Oscillospiraceae bacterium]